VFVAGVDGCCAGWVRFAVEVPSLATSVDVVDLSAWLASSPVKCQLVFSNRSREYRYAKSNKT